MEKLRGRGKWFAQSYKQLEPKLQTESLVLDVSVTLLPARQLLQLLFVSCCDKTVNFFSPYTKPQCVKHRNAQLSGATAHSDPTTYPRLRPRCTSRRPHLSHSSPHEAENTQHDPGTTASDATCVTCIFTFAHVPQDVETNGILLEPKLLPSNNRRCTNRVEGQVRNGLPTQ